MRIKADALGLLAEDYETDRILINDLYTGTIEVSVSAEKMAAFRADGQFELSGGRQYLPNEYCTLMEMLGDLNMGHEHHRSADLMRSGSIVVEALSYIRGRSIANQFMIIDEAQNLTPLETKTIITRVGNGTKIVFTGAPYQTGEDEPRLQRSRWFLGIRTQGVAPGLV